VCEREYVSKREREREREREDESNAERRDLRKIFLV